MHDVEDYGAALHPRITQRLLEARVPDLDLHPAAPPGDRGRFEDGSEPSEPLGPWSREQVDTLADGLDALIIGGVDIVVDPAPAPTRFFLEGLGARGAEVPTAWHGVGVPSAFGPHEAEHVREATRHHVYLSVLDEPSRRRLHDAGVEGEVVVVPDPAYAIEVLWGREAVEAAARSMRERGVLPATDVVVVQGGRTLLDHADALANQVARVCREHDLTPVLVETSPVEGDASFADAMAERLPYATRLGPDTGLADLSATIATSRGFIGSSLHGNIVAAAYDLPGLFLDLAGLDPRLEGQALFLDAPERLVREPGELALAFGRVRHRGSFAHHLDHLRRRLDAHADRLAALCTGAPDDAEPRTPRPEPPPMDERERLVRANAALADLLAAAQAAFADREVELRDRIHALASDLETAEARSRTTVTELDDLTRRLKEEVAWLRGVVAEHEAEIERLRAAGVGRGSRLTRTRLGRSITKALGRGP